MSTSPLVLFAALGAALLGSAASAQSVGPLAGADCREARLDKVVHGKVISTEPVVICKRTEALKAALANDGLRLGAAARKPEPSADARKVDHLAFTPPVPADRECAMLNCPTYILTGVGD